MANIIGMQQLYKLLTFSYLSNKTLCEEFASSIEVREG